MDGLEVPANNRVNRGYITRLGPLSGSLRCLILVLAVLFVSGCSTRFVYQNLDWLAHWYIDDYVDLTADQKKIFDQQMTDWLAWHRTEELPRYVADLDALADDLINGRLNQERLQRHLDQIQGHWDRVKARMVPDLARMAPMLEPDQIESMFAALEERNLEIEAEIRERALKENPGRSRWLERNVERLEKWVGTLNEGQSAQIDQLAKEYIPNREPWLQFRRDYQAALKTLLLSAERGPQFEAEFESILMNPTPYQSETYRENRAHNLKLWTQTLAQLAPGLTEQQRKRLLDRIDELRSDLEGVAQI